MNPTTNIAGTSRDLVSRLFGEGLALLLIDARREEEGDPTIGRNIEEIILSRNEAELIAADARMMAPKPRRRRIDWFMVWVLLRIVTLAALMACAARAGSIYLDHDGAYNPAFQTDTASWFSNEYNFVAIPVSPREESPVGEFAPFVWPVVIVPQPPIGGTSDPVIVQPHPIGNVPDDPEVIPTPEPTTGMMLAAAAFCFLAAGQVRRQIRRAR